MFKCYVVILLVEVGHEFFPVYSPRGKHGTIPLFLFVEEDGVEAWVASACCLRACFHTATLALDCVGNLRRFRQLSAYCASLYLVSFVESFGAPWSGGAAPPPPPPRTFHYPKTSGISISQR